MAKKKNPDDGKPPRGKPVKLPDNFDEAIDKLTGARETRVWTTHVEAGEERMTSLDGSSARVLIA